jgi:hypothetical protein
MCDREIVQDEVGVCQAQAHIDDLAKQDFKSSHCPRVFAGKRCKISGRLLAERCICERYAGSLLDHVIVLRTNTEGKVLLAQPYAIDGMVLSSFLQECDSLGLDVLCGDSPHHTSTFGIRITRRGENKW